MQSLPVRICFAQLEGETTLGKYSDFVNWPHTVNGLTFLTLISDIQPRWSCSHRKPTWMVRLFRMRACGTKFFPPKIHLLTLSFSWIYRSTKFSASRYGCDFGVAANDLYGCGNIFSRQSAKPGELAYERFICTMT